MTVRHDSLEYRSIPCGTWRTNEPFWPSFGKRQSKDSATSPLIALAKESPDHVPKYKKETTTFVESPDRIWHNRPNSARGRGFEPRLEDSKSLRTRMGDIWQKRLEDAPKANEVVTQSPGCLYCTYVHLGVKPN